MPRRPRYRLHPIQRLHALPLAWLLMLSLGQAVPPAARSEEEPRLFILDPAQSRVAVLLYREGLFSGFAHDHVLVAKGISGRLRYDPGAPERTSGSFVLPVAELEVDPPEEREREGLTENLSPEDRAEVRQAMLAADQLDGGRFPEIRAEVAGAEGRPPALTFRTAFMIKGVEKTVPVNLSLSLKGGVLTGEGEFDLLQSDFGIEPYNVFLATVAVQDRIRVRFRLVAKAVP